MSNFIHYGDICLQIFDFSVPIMSQKLLVHFLAFDTNYQARTFLETTANLFGCPFHYL